ncbi:NAPDH-dependent diflavin reductase [Zygosaccharomyces mellis]|uniref:NADPH-dependent diflavin oxidoreductase 1 n=1 Tax=Zygosaccharomyces mellis TaxID=42258 RepID=A0A4C2EAM8_9SACH|nr:NAPDH-dependent diflavin reductase [Zygosaccharomyces mellis]
MAVIGTSKRIAILYGSETGNSHDFAQILSFKLHRLHFTHTLCSLADYTPQDILSCRYLFIICSTTGQGELPRNVSEKSHGYARSNTLWSFLKRRNLPHDFLNHISVAFLGLGDSSYPKFNYGIRMLHKRIVNQLGARELFNRLEADELSMQGSNKGTGAGIETVYFEYERRILAFLSENFPYRKIGGQIIDRQEIPEDVYLEPLSFLNLSPDEVGNNKVRFEGDESIRSGKVVKNKRITSQDHFQDVRQFVFKMEFEEEYHSGDTVSIYPCNNDNSVNKFLELQPHWEEIADKPLQFTADVPDELKDGGLVRPLTLRNLLKYHCDIASIPRASFFMKVWAFATDASRLEQGDEQLRQQREKLHQFATDQDMQDLYDYCNRPRRSILEVLQDFLSINLPWRYALDYLPLIKPRYFSISSGPCDPDVELTVAIVKYKTMLRKVREGLCTTYLTSLMENDEIRYKVQNKNSFKKDELQGKPAILISPGVGLAPMMSVIRSKMFSNIHLFFGNRYKNSDFLYREQLEDWNQEGKIILHACFSRDRENSPNFKYVQDILWEIGETIYDLMVNKRAVLFLCGSSGKMPLQVRITLIEIIKKWGTFQSDEEAQSYLKNMEKENRYLQETW